MSSQKQEIINTIQEIESLSKACTHTFLLSLIHDDMDLDMWERLQDCLKEINTKSQEAFLLSTSLRKT